MHPALLSIAQTYAEAAHPRESCGLIVVEPGSHKGDYKPVRNLAETPDRFRIHPEDWADAEDFGRVAAVVHSHPGGDPMPSGADRASCDLSGLPWVVVAGDRWETIQPIGRPVEGREFCYGLDDCYGLVRDWFHQHGVTLPDFLRTPGFWKTRDLFGEGLSRAGFEAAAGTPEPGDGLLFNVHGYYPDHCGVYLGNGKMLHQPLGRLSAVEPVGRMAEKLHAVVRRIA